MQIRTLMLIGGLALLAGPAAMAQTPPPTGGGNDASKPPKPSDTITVTGCLTKGQTNSFVLTPTSAGDPLSSSVEAKTHKVVPTYMYQLSGGQNLEAYVGQIVTATGTVDRRAKTAANVDQRTERQADSSAAPQGKTPKVKTEEQAKIEARQLAVRSVTSTGKSCSSTAGTGASSSGDQR